MKELLYNKIDKKILKEKVAKEGTPRQVYSFYKYVPIEDPATLRDELYRKLAALEILGRIYIATEGINAQFSMSDHHRDACLAAFKSLPPLARLRELCVQQGLEAHAPSFHKLTIKVRRQLVSDGHAPCDIPLAERGMKLSPAEFDAAMDDEKTIVIDARNHYEHEVGHFENSLRLPVDTFRELLPKLASTLAGKEEYKLLLYCTGGIRCEKASAYLRSHGFKHSYQLRGGIIAYAHAKHRTGTPLRFRGKNFVFDNRLGERVSADILSHCHQCGTPCDDHTNCLHEDCHLLFLQCASCRLHFKGCCSVHCMEQSSLPLEIQRKQRRGHKKHDALSVHKSRAALSKVDTISHARTAVLETAQKNDPSIHTGL